MADDRFPVQLGMGGIGLNEKTMLKVMGKQDLGEFLKAREEYYDEWRSKQFSHKDFPLANLNKLLKEAKLDEINPNNLHFKRFAFRNDKNRLLDEISKNNKKIDYLT